MSSKRRQRRKSCVGKRRYSSQTEAVAALISAKRKGLHGMCSYKCRWGNHWHLGHPPKSPKLNTLEPGQN